jgi:hypothetical protein
MKKENSQFGYFIKIADGQKTKINKVHLSFYSTYLGYITFDRFHSARLAVPAKKSIIKLHTEKPQLWQEANAYLSLVLQFLCKNGMKEKPRKHILWPKLF